MDINNTTMKKIIIAVFAIIALASCSTMQINGVKVRDRASLSRGQRYALVAAGVAGYAVTSHYYHGRMKR